MVAPSRVRPEDTIRARRSLARLSCACSFSAVFACPSGREEVFESDPAVEVRADAVAEVEDGLRAVVHGVDVDAERP
jgi:hypothetical protein